MKSGPKNFSDFTIKILKYIKIDIDQYNIYFMLSYEATLDRNEDYFEENNIWLTRIKI